MKRRFIETPFFFHPLAYLWAELLRMVPVSFWASPKFSSLYCQVRTSTYWNETCANPRWAQSSAYSTGMFGAMILHENYSVLDLNAKFWYFSLFFINWQNPPWTLNGKQPINIHGQWFWFSVLALFGLSVQVLNTANIQRMSKGELYLFHAFLIYFLYAFEVKE